jgi:L-amino acid N-acyltransferase YncA
MAVIRLATEADAGQVQAIYAPVVRDTATSFEEEAPTAGEVRERILRTTERLPWLVCVSGAGVLGYAYAVPHRTRAAYRWSVEESVYVHESARRAGVGRALLTSLLGVLKVQGFYNVLAGITLPNPASVGLHEAAAFIPLGVYRKVGYKFGAWHDVLWLHRALREHGPDPAPPLSFAEAVSSPEWAAALGSGERLLRV